jgi:hypothetical protein
MVWILPAETDDALAPSDEADLPDPRKLRAVSATTAASAIRSS